MMINNLVLYGINEETSDLQLLVIYITLELCCSRDHSNHNFMPRIIVEGSMGRSGISPSKSVQLTVSKPDKKGSKVIRNPPAKEPRTKKDP